MSLIQGERPYEEGPCDLEILTVAARPRLGGMTSWMEQVAGGLSGRGWRVRVVAFSDEIDYSGHEGYEVVHVPTSQIGAWPIPALDKLTRWRRAYSLYRLWQRENSVPRLRLSDGTPGILSLAKRISEESQVPWGALIGGDIFAETVGGILTPGFHITIRNSLKSASRVFVDGKDLLESFVLNGVDKDKIRIQPHGVDLARFPKQVVERRFFSTSDPQARIKLVWHGRLSDNHGPLRFVEIATTVLRAEARMCGAGEEEERLMAALDGAGKSGWMLGRLASDEVGSFLSEGEVGVYPLKDMAGMPTVLLESMAAGLPTLVYPTGAVEDMVQHESNGFILRDRNEMVATVEGLAENADLRRTVGERARKTIEEEWSLEATLRRLESNLQEIVPL